MNEAAAWLIDRVEDLFGFAAEHRLATVIALGIIALWVLIRRLRTRRAASTAALKDPERMFTSEQRREGFERTGGRCEFDGWLVLNRCHRPAAHGDHWLPWSTGGATTMENFVSACIRCNTSKGAKRPTAGQTLRIALRRRRYFPAGLIRRPGAKYLG